MESLQKEFIEKGYVVIDTGIDECILDGAVDDLKDYFGPDSAEPIHTPHYDHNRIQDAWHISQNVLEIARSKKILDTLKSLYNKPADPFQTLNFYTGTQQAVHSDSIHFNSEPFGAMCGVWVALEDVGEDQGPLIYYPGSQKLPEMNYDYFDLEPSYDSYPQYLSRLQDIIEQHGFQPEYGILKKGQAVVWSANVFHGGSFQTNKELTRKSQVTHYYLGKPKCWRPSQSTEGRAYFKPERVRDMSGKPYMYPVKIKVETFGTRLLKYPFRRVKLLATKWLPKD